MYAKFHLEADCVVEKVDIEASAKAVEEAFEKLFDKDCGIKASVKVTGLEYYTAGEENECNC